MKFGNDREEWWLPMRPPCRRLLPGYPSFGIRELWTKPLGLLHVDPRSVATCLVVAGFVGRMLDRTSKLNHQAPPIPANAAWVEEAISLVVEHAIAATPELSNEHARTPFLRWRSILVYLQLASQSSISIGYTFKVMGTGLRALRAVARNDASHR